MTLGGRNVMMPLPTTQPSRGFLTERASFSMAYIWCIVWIWFDGIKDRTITAGEITA